MTEEDGNGERPVLNFGLDLFLRMSTGCAALVMGASRSPVFVEALILKRRWHCTRPGSLHSVHFNRYRALLPFCSFQAAFFLESYTGGKGEHGIQGGKTELAACEEAVVRAYP